MEIKINEKYKVSIFNQENEGLGVARIDNAVVFVENGLPGDIGEVEITEVKKNFARGKMVSFDATADGRQEAPCPYYNQCGGCDLQHQDYTHQLGFKEDKIKNALERIGGFKNVLINKIVFDSEFNYRNKVTLKVKKDKLGFYKRNTYDIVDIDNCLISNDKINGAIKVLKSFVKKYKNNRFDSIMIRYSNGLMISIDSKDDSLSDELVAFIPSKIDDLKSFVLNNKVLFGDGFVEEKINNLIFKLSPKSFYQVNNIVMNKLYDKAIEYTSNIQNDTILDLYCGIGTITSLLAKHSKRVIGVEVGSGAIANAEESLSINGINNVIFINNKVENAITELMDEKIDTIVMDPPRSGVDKSALDAILKINPKQIVYVSCNPVTLARDLKILCNEKYNLVEVTPFDMFPQTSHVETVVLMSKK